MATANLTAQRLRELLNYDPETGHFKWRVTRVGCGAGKIAGCVDKGTGYIVIKIDRQLHRAHRLAFLWMVGNWPADTIDHRNLQRSDNRWVNLREATMKQNQENLPLDPRNKSGHRGVHWCKEDSVWCASIGHRGRKIALGRSPDKQVAIALRIAGERHYFTHSAACAPQAESLDPPFQQGETSSAFQRS